MSANFHGRERELDRLAELTAKKTASLAVVKGRRRIGKSRLAAEFARRLPEFQALTFQGLPPTQDLTAVAEREDFALQLGRQLGIPPPRADDWNILFWALAERTAKGRQLIVFDEINWLGSKDPTFLAKLKNAWDGEFSKNPRLILILSGSLSGWIERNILHQTGFLGRVSLDFTLEELPLAACNRFWGARRNSISAFEKLRVLSVTGGVPRYLEEINPALTADANIQRLCFSREGSLFQEFDLIFHDLFSTRDRMYRDIVRALVAGPLELEQLYAALEVGKNGRTIEYAADLAQAGFLSRDFTWDLVTGGRAKASRWRLSDNYLRFYLRYIEPNRGRIERGTLTKLPAIDGILGLQFENLVLKNRTAIFHKLGVDPNDVLNEGPFFQTPTQRRKGCQIDYLIQTRQRALFVCEIKFSQNAVPAAVINEVEEKMARMSLPRRVSVRPVLIHAGGVADAVIEREYFAAMIDFGELLEG